MVKIYFALGHQQLEDYIKSSKPLLEKQLQDTIQFTGTALYREGILKNIENNPPDIILLREGLSGSTNISELVYQIRMKYPRIRIIFIAGDRNAGDPLLSTMVNYGIYDILVGSRVNAKDMLRKICKPSTLADVSFLIQKVTVDEHTNKQTFEVPDMDLVKENERRNMIDAANVDLAANDKTAQDLLHSLVQEREKEMSGEQELEEIHKSRSEELMQDFSFGGDHLSPIQQAQKIDRGIQSQSVIQESEQSSPIIQLHQEKEPIQPMEQPQEAEIQEMPKPIRPVSIGMEQQITEHIPVAPAVEPPKVSHKAPIEYYKENNQEFLSKPVQTVQGNDIFNVQVLKESAKYSEQFSQQVITFLGGNRGVGNTQLAFNTALNIAMTGKKTLYIDVNPIYCYSDALYQLSFENMGLNTALRSLETGALIQIERAIASTSKLMSFVSNNSNLAKLYNKFPSTFDFLTFSQEYLTKKIDTPFDVRYFNQLIEYLVTKLHYEVIVIDAVCDIYNHLTLLSILNSHKVVGVVSQDFAVMTNFVNMMRYLDREAIEFRSKMIYVMNRFQKHAITAKTVYSLIENNLDVHAFQLITMPDIYGDFLTANSNNVPIMWSTKDKTFLNGMKTIQSLL